MANANKIKVTQTKSAHGRLAAHRACAAGLGLRKIGHTVEVEDMINKIYYMVKVEGE